jgi:transposase
VKLQGEIEASLSAVLGVLIKQLGELEDHRAVLDKAIEEMSQTGRYQAAVKTLVREICGVQVLSAMVFLTELGDLSRFQNRGQIAAYLGLAPCSFESGQANDRKGHITRQGSPRVRKVLCQCVWTQVSHERGEAAAYRRIVERNPKKKKIAVVACMRRLAILMWHKASEQLPMNPTPSKQMA